MLSCCQDSRKVLCCGHETVSDASNSPTRDGWQVTSFRSTPNCCHGWCHRPHVDHPAVRSLADVQRFFLIMSPTLPQGALHRLIAIGKKRLPNPLRHERFFGIVIATASKVRTAPLSCSNSIPLQCACRLLLHILLCTFRRSNAGDIVSACKSGVPRAHCLSSPLGSSLILQTLLASLCVPGAFRWRT